MPNAYSKQIVYLSKAQYQELVANGTITVDGTTVTYDENDIYVTPQAESVTDVRVNENSITLNGIANIPKMSSTVFGVAKAIGGSNGVIIDNGGALRIEGAASSTIKAGTGGGSLYCPITPYHQHESAFYGLAKASGDTTQSQSSNVVGSYTPEAKAAIQSMLGVSDLIATVENTLVASKAYAIGDVFTANGKLYKAISAIAANDTIVLQNSGETVSGANAVETKVGEGFVKFTDYARGDKPGVIMTGSSYGLSVYQANGNTYIVKSTSAEVKGGTNQYKPIVPYNQHESAFYGLAKAAGDTTQSASSSAVGTYTDNAKASIKSMLGIVDGSTGTVDVSGTTPSITAVENTRYVCGEVSTLSFTPPASGISIVRFTSGTTATVLTLPSTVKFPEWFDATALETETIYEICVTDGIYGAVMSWAL